VLVLPDTQGSGGYKGWPEWSLWGTSKPHCRHEILTLGCDTAELTTASMIAMWGGLLAWFCAMSAAE